MSWEPSPEALKALEEMKRLSFLEGHGVDRRGEALCEALAYGLFHPCSGPGVQCILLEEKEE